MYTFKECSTSKFHSSVKENCEKARKPRTCTTKINIYSKNFFNIRPITNPSNRSYNFEVFVGADRLGDLICNRP